jgi:hypothetical protein
MACAYLHNFILLTNEEEQNEMDAELQRQIVGDIQELEGEGEDVEEVEEVEEVNLPQGQINPRTRRMMGAALINETMTLYREMHGF